MKNKRLIVLISIFAFLILIVILCSTLFTVKHISVNWLTQLPQGHELIGKDEEISSSIEKGGSVFLYDKQQAIETLEEKYPYLQVVKVETKFPNKLVLHVADRKEFFALKVNDNCFIVLDGKGKVLTKYNAEQYFNLDKNTTLIPVMVEVKGMVLNEGDYVVGKTANISRISSMLSTIYSKTMAFSDNNEDVAINFYESIVIDLNYNMNNITLNTKWHNSSIVVKNISSKLGEKIAAGLELHNVERGKGTKNFELVIQETINPETSEGYIGGEIKQKQG